MQIKTRVVPDSNVFIAGALNKSYCYDWLFGAGEINASYRLFTAENILNEVQQKLEVRFKFSREHTSGFLNQLDKVITKVRPSQKITVIKRDPDDNKILECAVEAKAELIISFDKDLLSLKDYNGIVIAHPRMLQHWFPQKIQP